MGLFVIVGVFLSGILSFNGLLLLYNVLDFFIVSSADSDFEGLLGLFMLILVFPFFFGLLSFIAAAIYVLYIYSECDSLYVFGGAFLFFISFVSPDSWLAFHLRDMPVVSVVLSPVLIFLSYFVLKLFRKHNLI